MSIHKYTNPNCAPRQSALAKAEGLQERNSLRARRHSGSVIGIVLAALFLVTLTVMALNQTATMFQSTQINAASAEVIRIIHAQQAFRLVEQGLTTLTNVKKLLDDGYDLGAIQPDGNNGKNLYGLAVTIVAGAVTYTLREQAQCNQLMNRIENSTNYATAPACTAAGQLSFTID
ncbi:MAG: hypothetical protein OXC05_02415 [Halieaceae bacterium]|nr:hypothetical protein [Halieaceae bacterium]